MLRPVGIPRPIFPTSPIPCSTTRLLFLVTIILFIILSQPPIISKQSLALRLCLSQLLYLFIRKFSNPSFLQKLQKNFITNFDALIKFNLILIFFIYYNNIYISLGYDIHCEFLVTIFLIVNLAVPYNSFIKYRSIKYNFL